MLSRILMPLRQLVTQFKRQLVAYLQIEEFRQVVGISLISLMSSEDAESLQIIVILLLTIFIVDFFVNWIWLVNL